MAFTPEELEEMRRADAEIEASFRQTREEIRASQQRDREALLSRKDNYRKRIAEYQKAYYASNREKIAESRKAYYASNREKIAEYQVLRLKHYRKSQNLNQKKFGELIGVSRQTINMWENGALPINISRISSAIPELGVLLQSDSPV